MVEPTQIARSPLLLLSYADRQGLDRDALLAASSISIKDLVDPDSRIPVSAMKRLWRAVMTRDSNPELGLKVGQTVTAKRMGLVGYMMSVSADLLDALDNLARYGRLISDALQFRITRQGNAVHLRMTVRPYMIALQHPIAASVASVLTIAREITRTDLVPEHVTLPIPRPDAAPSYRAFFRAPISYAGTTAEIQFTAAQAATPVVAHDDTLGGYLDELADAKLEALGDPDTEFTNRVRRSIWTTLQSGKPSLYRTARHLGLTARTLQRRLGEHGTSYSAILEELRRELSSELRHEKRMSAADVAFLLGYSEPSAYQRALRRWRSEADKKAS